MVTFSYCSFCRIDHEFMADGYMFRKGRMKVIISKIFKVCSKYSISTFGLKEILFQVCENGKYMMSGSMKLTKWRMLIHLSPKILVLVNHCVKLFVLDQMWIVVLLEIISWDFITDETEQLISNNQIMLFYVLSNGELLTLITNSISASTLSLYD